ASTQAPPILPSAAFYRWFSRYASQGHRTERQPAPKQSAAADCRLRPDDQSLADSGPAMTSAPVEALRSAHTRVDGGERRGLRDIERAVNPVPGASRSHAPDGTWRHSAGNA